MINGNGLHHIAIIIRECTPVANSTPHAHVKCVVGGRLLSVVQPEHKIVLLPGLLGSWSNSTFRRCINSRRSRHNLNRCLNRIRNPRSCSRRSLNRCLNSSSRISNGRSSRSASRQQRLRWRWHKGGIHCCLDSLRLVASMVVFLEQHTNESKDYLVPELVHLLVVVRVVVDLVAVPEARY